MFKLAKTLNEMSQPTSQAYEDLPTILELNNLPTDLSILIEPLETFYGYSFEENPHIGWNQILNMGTQ